MHSGGASAREELHFLANHNLTLRAKAPPLCKYVFAERGFFIAILIFLSSMTYSIVQKSLLEETRGIIVHGANAQGVMGAGFAKALCDKYPQVRTDYLGVFKKNTPNRVHLGQSIFTQLSPELLVVTGVTQKHYGHSAFYVYVDYHAIQMVFEEVNKVALRTGLPVLFPLIGCGLAGGHWPTVHDIIVKALDPSVEASLFVPR